MRFHIGEVPEDPFFDPSEHGWSDIREPGPAAIQLYAFPVAILAALILSLVIFAISPDILTAANRMLVNAFSAVRNARELARQGAALGEIAGLLGRWLAQALLFCAGLLALILAHELLHALCTPGWGASSLTIIAAWPQKLLFYAHYLGVLSRNRFLLVLIAPLLALSLAPLILIAALAWLPGSTPGLAWLALICLVNSMCSSGDIISFGLLLWQIPAIAEVRNQGWQTYWRAVPSTLEIEE